jgi:hypothetical protein
MTILTGRILGAHVAPGPSTAAGHPADLVCWARELADSAEAIATAAGTPGAAAAIASALAHIETALENLEQGTDEMEGAARARLTDATLLLGDPWNHVLVARTTHDFEDLARALANARRACEKVRRNAGPILAELTAV